MFVDAVHVAPGARAPQLHPAKPEASLSPR